MNEKQKATLSLSAKLAMPLTAANRFFLTGSGQRPAMTFHNGTRQQLEL